MPCRREPTISRAWIAAAVLALPSPAPCQERERSQVTDDRVRLAEALFDEAKDAMKRDDLAVACSKLEESRRLDPAGGTQLALAVCYERAGRVASAWYAFRGALAAAQRDGRADREAIAAERLAELEPKLSRVTVLVPERVAKLPEIRVELGATELRSPSWGVAVPFDAGSYPLRVSAPGYRPFTRTVTVGTADHRRIEVPMLEPVHRAPATRSVPKPSETPAPDGGGALHRKLGYVFLGAATAALLPGMYFGGRAMARAQTVNDACNGGVCPLAVEQDHTAAMSDALRANVLIGTGIIAAGVSVYFFLTAGTSRAASPAHASTGPGSLGFEF